MNFRQDEGVEKGVKCLIGMYNLIKNVEMYSAKHPASKEIAGEWLAILQSLLEWQKEIHVVLDNEGFYIGTTVISESIVTRNPVLTRLRTFLQDKHIESVSFNKSTTEQELIQFADSIKAVINSKADARKMISNLHSLNNYAIRINEAPSPNGTDSIESLLLSHFLDGSLGSELSEEIRDKLLNELLTSSRSVSRQIIEQIMREEAFNYPIIARDALSFLGDKWFFLVGTIILQVLGDKSIESRDVRALAILRKLATGLLGIAPERRGSGINDLFETLDLIQESHISTVPQSTTPELEAKKVEQLWGYWKELDSRNRGMEQFISRVSALVTEVIETGNTDKFDMSGVFEELMELLPRIMIYPSLSEKVFSAVTRLSQPRFVYDVITFTITAYAALEDPNPEVTAAFQNRILQYSAEDRESCSAVVTNLLRQMIETDSDQIAGHFAEIFEHLVKFHCQNCDRVSSCKVIGTAADHIANRSHSRSRAISLIRIWQDAAHALLVSSPIEFRQTVTPLANMPLNPEDFGDFEIREMLTKAWKSFAQAPIFQDVFKNLVVSDRDTRFKTIKELSRYNAFAVWICLAGLNTQNWYLRRNLATVLSQVVDFDKTNLLRDPLRDPDWHVRFEIISGLANRLIENPGKIPENPDLPIHRIFNMALRDGNRSIRYETYRVIEQLKMLSSLRSLKELYLRLATVNSDLDLEERTRLIRLFALLTQAPNAPFSEIIQTIAEIATQKEGIITPGWMIPLKRAAVEGLAMIQHPDARKWLETLANEKPYKRGVVGREARAALAKN